MTPEEQAGNGLAEPSQQELERRALKLAAASGRDQFDENDLAEARREILGPDASTQPVECPRPKKP